MIGNIINEGYK